MRKMIIALLAVLASTSAQASTWTSEDTAWELAYLASHVADWGQTRDISAQCQTGAYYETNPVMGKCPTSNLVNTYFLGTALAHLAVAHMLPTKYRRTFQSTTFAMQMGFVTNNANIGLSIKF